MKRESVSRQEQIQRDERAMGWTFRLLTVLGVLLFLGLSGLALHACAHGYFWSGQ